MTCGDELQGVIDGVRHRNRVGPEPGWGGMQHATGDYSAEVHLAPGFALTNTWDAAEGAWYWAGSQIAPCHTCGDKEIRNSPEKGPVAEPYLGPDWNAESYANGQLVFRPDLSRADSLRSFVSVENSKLENNSLVPVDPGQPARATVLLQSPYLMTQAHGSAEGVEQFEISLDAGKTWKASNLKDFGKAVGGQLAALARITFRQPVKDLRLDVTVQNNPFALPFLSPGRNVISVSAVDPATLGNNKLVVTYAYRPGARRKSYEQLAIEGKEIARAHDASWESTPTIVQKIFTAKDLPAQFTIDVPTPPGMHPVYPRMLFVRREVLAPDQEPLPLPEKAHPPQSKPGDELKTLPNPLLAGIQEPPPKIVRPVKTITLELSPQGVVTKSGKTAEGDYLRWPKNSQEKVDAVAYLVGGELNDLPSLKQLAAARLVIPLIKAHDKAPAKLGVTALQAAPVSGKTFDFAKLGEVVGSATIPLQPADSANWTPPKSFKVDVTRLVRTVINGDARFQGFGLRIVPDRGIDDGWTVRVQLPQQPKVMLELDVYTGAE